MKVFFSLIKKTSIPLGAILGAGFLSGAELLIFLGENGWLRTALVSSVVIFVLLWFCYSFAQIVPKNTSANRLVFRNAKWADGVCLFFNSVVAVVMLSSLDDLFNVSVGGITLPLSAVALIVAILLCQKGKLTLLVKVNSLLMLVLVVSLSAVIIKRGIYINLGSILRVNGKRYLKCIVYAFFNIFLAFYPITEYKEENSLSKKATSLINFFSALIVAVIVFIMEFLIMGVILKNNSQGAPVPIIHAIGENQTIVKVVLSIGIFSSLITSVYTILSRLKLKQANGLNGRVAVVVLFLVIWVLSLVDIERIMTVGYTVAGGLGSILFVGFVKYFFVNCIKARGKTDNTLKHSKGEDYVKKKEKQGGKAYGRRV